MSLLLITLGLRPYRLLTQLESKPHELAFDGKSYIFAKKGSPLFSIPKENIGSLSYFEKELTYGIAIQLVGNVDLLQKFDLPSFVTDSRMRAECDLFLPYFTKSSLELLETGLDEIMHLDDADN